MMNEDNILMVAMTVIAGILGDIYRRFASFGKYKESIVRMETSLRKQENDILEMKDDIKYLVRKDLNRTNDK